MRNGLKYIVGALLVIFGILIIWDILSLDFSWIFNLTWPMIIVAVGIFFFMGYYSRRPYGTGFLVPAGFFITIGVACILGEISSIFLGPGFIAAPAVGLLLLYIYGSRMPGLLVPIGTLFTLSGVVAFADLFNVWEILIPGFFMAPAVGLFLLYLGGRRNPALLIPVFILTSISVTIFSFFFMSFVLSILKYIIGGALIAAGIMSFIRKPYRRDNFFQNEDQMNQ